jgi:alkylation response protein AidB-like acyl-CoA dehydrogenase
MDFMLTDEQVLLQETARRLLAAECPTSLVRAHTDDRSVAGPGGLWRHLGEWTELGSGPLVDLCLFLEETGAVVAPGPFLATTLLWPPLASAASAAASAASAAASTSATSASSAGGSVQNTHAGGGSSAQTLATGIHSGGGTVALAGASGQWTPNDEPIRTFVLDIDLVDHVAVVSAAPGGPTVAIAATADLARREVKTLDPTRRVFEVTVPDGLSPVAIEPDAVSRLLERAWVGLAAEMLGTARWLFDRTLEYAKQREQFGRPIGSFQAIQHKLANMALVRERAWAAVYYAAMCVDADDADAPRAAHVAKASAGEAVRLCAKDGIQIHGGIGFTWEHDLHLFLRRAFASEHLLGTTDWHYDRLADLVFA